MDAALAYSHARLQAKTLPQRDHASTGAAAAGIRDKARKTAQDFEATFLNTMMEQMFTGIDTAPPFGGGSAEKIYRSMLVGEFSKDFSRNGGIGVADFVYRELLAAQEARTL